MKIFLIACTTLFLELLCIRLIGSEVRIFAYLQNSILIVCFLSIGFGCFLSKSEIKVWNILLPLAILIGCLSISGIRQGFAAISVILSGITSFTIWYPLVEDASSGLSYLDIASALTLFLIIIHLVWELFFPLGVMLGRAFSEAKNPITAYSQDIFGSLTGVLLFVLLSSLSLPPGYWILSGLFLIFCLDSKILGRRGDAFLSLIIIILCLSTSIDEEIERIAWSPYQKLSIFKPDSRGNRVIRVNNVGYQVLLDTGQEGSPITQYDLPFLSNKAPGSVLVVGAGSGNDVAAALKHGASQVTAVEIDPMIAEFGKLFHPSHPYESLKVELVLDDARSFFERTDKKFDYIIFGLLDSHTLSNMTNVRLDHFVYTLESLKAAGKLLKADGILSLSFATAESFQFRRLNRMFEEVFGDDVESFMAHGSDAQWGGAFFVHGPTTALKEIKEALPAEYFQYIDKKSGGSDVPITTDSWPYFYLPDKAIPNLYILLFSATGLYAFFAVFRRLPALRLSMPDTSSLFFGFLGAAFLLFETTTITRASLLLGTTWIVNAAVISGILTMIFLANLSAGVFRKHSLWIGAVGVFVSLAIVRYANIQSILTDSYLPRLMLGTAIASIPMYFSGLIFAEAFQKSKCREIAFGANLIGCFAGAILQILSMRFGLDALLWLIAGLYLCAILLRSLGSGEDLQYGSLSSHESNR